MSGETDAGDVLLADELDKWADGLQKPTDELRALDPRPEKGLLLADQAIGWLRTAASRLRRASLPVAPPPVPQTLVTIDARCGCSRCIDRTGNIYRMIGRCDNCGADNFLILYREGDPASSPDCPKCGGFYRVMPLRLATEDEIPAPRLAASVTGEERR